MLKVFITLPLAIKKYACLSRNYTYLDQLVKYVSFIQIALSSILFDYQRLGKL